MKRSILVLISIVQCLYAKSDVDQLKETVVKELPSIYGWCSSEKALNFINLVMTEKPQIWVEIGVFGGSSLFPVASAFRFLNFGKVIAIDPWDKTECIKYYDPLIDAAHLKWWSSVNQNDIYSSFLNILKAYQLEPFCDVIRMTSEKAIEQIESIDVLYIDGSHSEIGSVQDVQLYLPKVRSQGYIWINDSTWFEMQQAVEILAKQCDIIKFIDNGNCILFKKR